MEKKSSRMAVRRSVLTLCKFQLTGRYEYKKEYQIETGDCWTSTSVGHKL
jgi:hypothetical protein